MIDFLYNQYCIKYFQNPLDKITPKKMMVLLTVSRWQSHASSIDMELYWRLAVMMEE